MRRKLKSKRQLTPDYKYQSVKVTKLVNYLMEKGHKNISRGIVYGAFDDLKEKTKRDPMELFEEAINNAAPQMEIKTRRVGGANYQIPFPIQGHRQLHYAFMWLVQSARARKGAPYADRLMLEIVDAYNETGATFKKKEDTHKMAEANRAFAHFARG